MFSAADLVLYPRVHPLVGLHVAARVQYLCRAEVADLVAGTKQFSASDLVLGCLSARLAGNGC